MIWCLARAVGTSYATRRATILLTALKATIIWLGVWAMIFSAAASGRDRFVLTAGSGPDLITDLTKGEDWLVLASGLTFAQLSITQNANVAFMQNAALADWTLIAPAVFNQTVRQHPVNNYAFSQRAIAHSQPVCGWVRLRIKFLILPTWNQQKIGDSLPNSSVASSKFTV